MTKPPTKPDFCPFVYHDGESLFLEFTGQVLRFAYTEGGLHRALKHIPNVAHQPGFLSGRSNIAKKVLPKVAKTTRHRRETTALSQDLRNAASALIRNKRGVS